MLVNLKFHRVDYAQVGATSRGCMRLIRSDKDQLGTPKSTSRKGEKRFKCRIVIGGNNGALLCLEIKTDETKVIFKNQSGPPISFIRLGGALHTVQDKIFVANQNTQASGAQVRGYSRKGKQFLSFESNMTENISSMYIYGVDMFLVGRNTLYHFHDCVEKNTYMCTDQITDVICLPIVEGGWVGRGITPVISCEDKTIKVLQENRLAYEILLGDIPNVLHLFMNDGGLTRQKMVYGTKNGRIGLIDLKQNFGTILWEMGSSNAAAISAIYFHPISKNTSPDLLVGKEDGLIEIFSIDELDNASFRQSYSCDDSITSMECINVPEEEYDEIIVCTYTGWVFGLSTEPSNRTNGTSTQANVAPQLKVKVQQMQNEIEELEHKLKEEKDRYQETMQRAPEEAKKLSRPRMSYPNLASIAFSVNDRFVLDKELACYTLSLELTIPIEYVFLQSDVNIELMDVERNSAVISVTPPDPQSENQLLAVYRCQADITRMEIRIRSIEGQFGVLRAYLVPHLQTKTCQMRSYTIKPLALHERIHIFDVNRPVNTLTFTGSFSISEAHSWLALCVSQIPERCPQDDSVTYNFQSTFNGGTILQATYTKGTSTYKSDSLSTIIILRDIISKLVTAKQLKVQISCDFNEATIEHTLRLIHPKMEYQFNLSNSKHPECSQILNIQTFVLESGKPAFFEFWRIDCVYFRKVELANGLKELEAAFGDLPYLNNDLKMILQNHDKLFEESDEKYSYFDRIVGVIVDLFIDSFKINGQSVPSGKANELLQILNDSYSFPVVLKFFQDARSQT